VVAIDGTKLTANASREANLDYERIAREILAEAKAIDGAEDERYGEARGDELPDELQTSDGQPLAARSCSPPRSPSTRPTSGTPSRW
jgi:hypothetical protein